MKQYCWPWWLAKYLTFLPRYRACFYHDKRYEYTKIRNENTRKIIDKIFLHQMLIEKPNIFTAYIYYILVRLFGWILFYKIIKKMKDKIEKLSNKIDCHFKSLNEKFDNHEATEYSLLDKIMDRLNQTDIRLKALENDVSKHKWLIFLISVSIVILVYKAFI